MSMFSSFWSSLHSEQAYEVEKAECSNHFPFAFSILFKQFIHYFKLIISVIYPLSFS